LAYNTSVHATTNKTPYMMMYGRDPISPLPVEAAKCNASSEYVHQLQDALQSRQAGQQTFEKMAVGDELGVGTPVLVLKRPAPGGKLDAIWKNGFVVVRAPSRYTRVVLETATGREHLFPLDHLKAAPERRSRAGRQHKPPRQR
jgi:hypothetical protein